MSRIDKGLGTRGFAQKLANKTEALCKHLAAEMEHSDDRAALLDLAEDAADLWHMLDEPAFPEDALNGIAEALR